MPARKVIHTREVRDDGSIVEIVVWELDKPVPPCNHRYKYRLFYGRHGHCYLRYDNERGKGDHRHNGNIETSYSFVSIEVLLDDFQRDIESREVP